MQANSLKQRTKAARRVILIAIPVRLVFASVGLAMLYGYTPSNYAANYTPVRSLTTSHNAEQFAALALPNGGLGVVEDISQGDSQFQLAYNQYDKSMNLQQETVLARNGLYESSPALAVSGSTVVAVWVHDFVRRDQSELMGRIVNSQGQRNFVIMPPVGSVEHPSIVAAPGGRFDVAFSLQKPGGEFQLYLASFSAATGHVFFSRLIVPSTDYAFYPQIAIDGSRHIDLLYMQGCCQTKVWHMIFYRFTTAGHLVGSLWTKGQCLPANNGCMDTLNSLGPSQNSGPIKPQQWGISVQPGRRGTVWAAWQGDTAIRLAHWSSSGRLLTHTVIDRGDVSNVTPAAALVPFGAGGAVYYMSVFPNCCIVNGIRFDAAGQPSAPQRTEYVASGVVSNPVAVPSHGLPVVLWKDLDPGGTQADIQLTSYAAKVDPSLPERLGINVGDAWTNLGIITVVSTIGAALLTAANILFVVMLALLWFLASRLRVEWQQWLAYVAAIACVLWLAVAAQTFISRGVVVMQPFRSPYGALVVVGAVFTSVWLGRKALPDLDGILRAGFMAAVAMYFVAFMWLVTFAQSEIGRI